MKLFYTPFIGLVHKVQVVAIETGVYDDLDRNPIIPYEQREELVAVNPLSKVPTLVLDDGTPLPDMETIRNAITRLYVELWESDNIKVFFENEFVD